MATRSHCGILQVVPNLHALARWHAGRSSAHRHWHNIASCNLRWGCGALKYHCSCPSCAVPVTMHCDVSLRLHLPIHLTFNTTGNINSTRHVCSVQCVVVCVWCVSLCQYYYAHNSDQPTTLVSPVGLQLLVIQEHPLYCTGSTTTFAAWVLQ